MRQHEAVVQIGAPAHRLALLRLAPEPGHQRPEQQLLGEAHARVRRHFERAELDESQPPSGAVGRIELVDADLGAMRVAGHIDEQIAEQPVDDPDRRAEALRRHLRERNLELVQLVVAGFVQPRRLTGRPDEQAREQIRKRRMALPIKHQARQQIGPAQERRILRRRAAEHDMVAPAGAGVATIG
jgi:hypothetical protein